MIPTLAAIRTVVSGIPLGHLAVAISIFVLLNVVAALFDPKKFREAIQEVLHAGNIQIRIIGVLRMLIAFLILNTYWKINFTTPKTFMSVLGYLLLLRGVMCFFFPSSMRALGERFMRKDSTLYIFAFIALVAGLGLGYLGLFVY